MALDPETEQRLNHFAEEARAEFVEKWKRDNWGVREVAEWWAKWGSEFGKKTNPDRLGRILMEETGVKPRKAKLVKKIWPD